MKKILSCALAAVTVVLTLLVTSAYAAGEKELPTIIVNDEKWYKDTHISERRQPLPHEHRHAELYLRAVHGKSGGDER